MDKKVSPAGSPSRLATPVSAASAWSRFQRILRLREPMASGRELDAIPTALEKPVSTTTQATAAPTITSAQAVPAPSQGVLESEVVWARQILRLVDAIVRHAPLGRVQWAVKLRIKHWIMPATALAVEASPEQLILRFCTAESSSLDLLSRHAESLRGTLELFLGKTVAFEVKHEYFGLV